MKSKVRKHGMAYIMAAAMVIAQGLGGYAGVQAAAVDYSEVYASPMVTEVGVTYDTIYFGTYPQSLKAGAAYGSADSGSYETEPIRWRVLSVENNVATVAADRILEYEKYNDTNADIKWEQASLRTWLNQTFINAAFTQNEQSALKEHTTELENGLDIITVKDKVSLLTNLDIWEKDYGYAEGETALQEAFEMKNTDYAASKIRNKIAPVKYNEVWGLCDTLVYGDHYGNIAMNGLIDDMTLPQGIVPVLDIDLSRTDCYQNGGQVTYYKHTYALESASGSIANPRVNADGSVVYDAVYFGSYPQYKMSDEENYEVAAIKWRVLSVKDKTAMLIADKALDMFIWELSGTSQRSFAYDVSDIRSWLNGYSGKYNNHKKDYSKDNFIDKAFTKTEQKAIKAKSLSNQENPVYHISSGGKTKDKITLLSLEDAVNPSYGFRAMNLHTTLDADALEVDYAKERELTPYAVSAATVKRLFNRQSMANAWYLRTMGWLPANVTDVAFNKGNINLHGHCGNVAEAVVPVLYLDLSKTSVWSNAGTVVCQASPSCSCHHMYETMKTKGTVNPKAKAYNNVGSSAKRCVLCKYLASTKLYDGNVTASLSKYEFTYNKKVQKPKVTVKDRSGKKLKLNKDYKVTFPKGCKKVGKYKVKLTFIGNYKGTLTLTYNIVKKR